MPPIPVYASDYNSDLTTLETNYGTQFDDAPDDQLVYLAQRDFCNVYDNADPAVADWDTENCLTSYMGCSITWTEDTSIIKIEKGDYSLTQDVMLSFVSMGDNWTYGDETPTFSNTTEARLNSYHMKSDYTSEIDLKKIRRKQLNNIGWDVSGGDIYLKTDSFVSIDEDCFIAESDELLFQGGSSGEYEINPSGNTVISADFDGTYYAVIENTYNPPTLWYTTDPTGTWTSRAITESSRYAYKVKYFEETGYWYLVGEDGLILRTTDITGSWTNHSISIGNYDCNSIEYYDGLYVIGGSNVSGVGVNYYYSTNGTTWTSGNVPQISATNIGDVNDLACHNGTWVGICRYGHIIYSTDPTSSWTVQAVSGGGLDNQGVTYDETNNYWVLTTGVMLFYGSTPGSAFTSVSGTTIGFSTNYIYDVKYYDGTLWCVSRNGELAYATNPSSWTLATPVTTELQICIYYGSGGLLIGCNNGIITYQVSGLSSGSYIYFNGTDWETSTTEIPIYDATKGGYFHPDKVDFYNYRCVAYWNGSEMEPVKIKRGEIY